MVTDLVDVAIVGAGAAGISAARRLTSRGRSVLLIEALSRLGGRGHTVEADGMQLDLGCGWFHSAERNPLRQLADELSLKVDRSESAWGRQLGARGFSASDQKAAWQAYQRFCSRLSEHPPASDRASDALDADEHWVAFINSLSTFINGTELDQLSALDFTAYDEAASETNWRLPTGYGAFIGSLGRDIPGTLDTTVISVDEDAGEIETSRGTLRAKAIIVSVSTAVLASGKIRFKQSATDHLHAASCLPLGLADKVFLALANPALVPDESHLLGRNDAVATGSYYLKPFGRPVIEVYLGGRHAGALESAGAAAAVSFAVEELVRLLGSHIAGALRPIAISRWGQEPTFGGSYSHALPGHADKRAVLARPVNEKLCFAGEACSPSDFSTAHGAWESGIVAADWIESHL